MERYVIGLDFGTLSARGILADCADGRILAEAERAYRHGVISGAFADGRPLPEGWALQDAADYEACLSAIVPELLRMSGVKPERVAGVGIDFTACTLLPVDAENRPLSEDARFRGEPHAYGKLWKHHGAQAQAERVNRLLEERGLRDSARFGGSVSPELLLPKAMELAADAPEVYAAADALLEAGDWLTRLLTGETARSASMAGYKAWWNGDYPDVMEALLSGVLAKLRGRICPVGGRIGTVNAEWARRLGLTTQTAVAACMIDSHAGVPGSGISTAAQAMLVLGTSSVLAAFGDAPYSEKGVYGGFAGGILPGKYAYESGVAAVGDLFAWFADRCSPAEFAREAEARGISPQQLLGERAARLTVTERTPMAVDWWNGCKTPFVDGSLTGSLFGLTLSTRPEEIYYALAESTAFAAREILELYEARGVCVSEILCSGGVAVRSPFIRQLYADALGVPLKLAGAEQTAALGSAIYAALASGVYDDYAVAVERMAPPPALTVFPDEARRSLLDRRYGRYGRFRDAAAAIR